jgi:uncharacterized protein YndB with AHSA1/START domain
VRSVGSDVVVQRVLPALPERVYREWTDPALLGEWMCPQPARATSIELDPRIGGHMRIGIVEGDLSFDVVGEYVELEPPHRLAFTWHCSHWPDHVQSSLVTVTIEDHDSHSSLMTIRHSLLDADLRAQHEDGWRRAMEQLEEGLRSR